MPGNFGKKSPKGNWKKLVKKHQIQTGSAGTFGYDSAAALAWRAGDAAALREGRWR
jgi:hypothetical protein